MFGTTDHQNCRTKIGAQWGMLQIYVEEPYFDICTTFGTFVKCMWMDKCILCILFLTPTLRIMDVQLISYIYVHGVICFQ